MRNLITLLFILAAFALLSGVVYAESRTYTEMVTVEVEDNDEYSALNKAKERAREQALRSYLNDVYKDRAATLNLTGDDKYIQDLEVLESKVGGMFTKQVVAKIKVTINEEEVLAYAKRKDLLTDNSEKSPQVTSKNKSSLKAREPQRANIAKSDYSTVNSSGNTTIPPPTLPPVLNVKVEFVEPSKNNILDAEEIGKLLVNVGNSGKGDAFDVNLNISADKKILGLKYQDIAKVGKIQAGKSISKEIILSTTDKLPTDRISFTIEAKEANGFDAQPSIISFNTNAFEPPSLIVADIGISDQNGGTKVEQGKLIDVVARVQNIGRGNAQNVVADVQKGENVFFGPDSQNRFDIGTLASGKFTDIKFQFLTNNRIKNGDNVPLTIKLSESHPRYGTSKQLALVMKAPQKFAQEFIVKSAEVEQKGEIKVAGGLSVDVDQNIPEGQKAGKFDVAVIIGNKSYSNSGAPDIDYANRDAQVMRDYLIRTMGYDAANIIYVEDATLTKFYQIFGTKDDHKGQLFKWVKPGQSKIFIYYVGHGAPDAETAEAYFVPVDANPQYLKTSGYRLQTFYDNLAKISAQKVTVVIDACFSGATPKGSLFKGTSALVRQEKVAATKPINSVLMTSSSGEQFSSWYPEKKHSLFTYYFLKGLGGEADTNKDGVITVSEMRSYLADQVPYMARRLTGNEQTPQVEGGDKEVIVRLIK